MLKNELRNKFKKLRSQLSPKQVEDYSLDIANQLLSLDIWDHNMYHLFLSIEQQKEVQTDFILHILQGKDKNVIVSRSNFEDYSMKHYLLTDNTVLKTNKWGIPEPSDNGILISEDLLDVVFIPLLAGDTNGNRIGYGKGFYDRFLKKCRPNTLKIGLSFYHPLTTTITPHKDDVPLNIMVCPDQVFFFDSAVDTNNNN
ncbi:5-formyltetrahydrofolate cyclo-ligase [Nonlabens sp.]|uniref:5-formyltetrahydrofolate cyclo-ligase n=1 Tax=Nonlabens sp. TaxID=1888209 RepID=UPI003F69C9CD